jgi:DNA-binding GntR family transcriptional regulator
VIGPEGDHLYGARAPHPPPHRVLHQRTPNQQLAAQLRGQIKSSEITFQLPSVTDLTTETGLAVGTVRRAIDILVKEGAVQTVPGRGTFVRR